MKVLKVVIQAIFLIFTVQDLASQNPGVISDIYSGDCIQCLTGELFTPAIKPDPATYFNPEWLAADLYLSNGEIVRNKLIKYNGLLDELLWKEPKSGNIIKLDKEPIMKFHFLNLKGDTTIYFRKINIKRNALSDSGEVFGELIYDKGNSLCILHTFNIKGTEIVRSNGTIFERTIYEKIPIYVFMFPKGKTFITRNLNRRSFSTICPENKDRINDFLKVNISRKPIEYSYLRKLTEFLGTIVVGGK
jgi:hypothetical protein